jgi:1,2-phenylacetyl-CoA epoxidase catalytic subunit
VSDLTPTGPVVDLLGMLAYAELLAFERLADDAKLAPDVSRRAVLSEMAASEISNYRRIAARLAELGADPEDAMAPFRQPLDDYHDQTQPSSWLEALTKAYVGDSIADDFVREVAQGLSPPDRDLVLEVLHDSQYADYAAREIQQALAEDPSAGNRLSMWARRLVGEALRQSQRVAAERPALAQLLVSGGDGDLSTVASILKRLTAAHTARMSTVGLNN